MNSEQKKLFSATNQLRFSQLQLGQLAGIGWGHNAIKRILRAALLASEGAKHRTAKMGAAVVQNRTVIGSGRNYTKTHSRSHGPFRQVHAEAHALDRARRTGVGTVGATLVVVRKLADQTLGVSRPCSACFRAAQAAGIKRIVYTDWGGQFCVLDLRGAVRLGSIL